MPILNKVYRFRMEPTVAQGQAMMRQAGAGRFVWNWALARRKEYYAETGKTIPPSLLSAELTALKSQPEMAWLKELNASSLQQVLRDLDNSFRGFFVGYAGHPRFKSKKHEIPRFRMSRHAKVSDEKVFVSKVGRVKIRQSQPVDLPTKSAAFKRDATGHWFVTIVAEFEMPDVPLPEPDPVKTVGIDLGLTNFAAFSDGLEPIPAPKFYRKGQRKLRKVQRVLSRRKSGSNRRAKAKRRVAIVHRKFANQRSDFLHKLTTGLANQYDGLCIEDLCVYGLARTKLSKSVNDASWGEFRRQLTYKSEWNRKSLAVIDRWFPSTKMCNTCKSVNHELTLKDRVWDCPACGANHDRDVNAARNIRDEGLRILAVGQTDKLNARGRPVRPAKAGAAG